MPAMALPFRRHSRRLLTRALLLFTATCLAATAVAAETTFQPKHIAALQSVVELQVAPNGQFAAYGLALQRTPLKDKDGPPWVELHVVDRAGNSRGFVTGQLNVSQLRWSPDSRRIYYVARRGEDTASALYAIPIDGGESTKILEHPTGISGFDLDREGKRVAFLAASELSADVKATRDKGFNQQIYEEDWQSTQVHIADLAEPTQKRTLGLKGSASQVEWHPNGKELLVVLAPTPSVDDSYMFKRIHIVDAETGRVLESIANPGKLGVARWSPSGKHVAFISGADIHDPAEGRLMVVSLPGGGGDPRDLMPDYQAHVNSFAWEKDDSILWLGDEGLTTTLGRVDLAGKVTPVVRGGETILAGISLNDAADAAFAIGHSPKHPPEVFDVSPQSGAARRLTQHNPWLETMTLAVQEPITWSARDGLSLEGVLVKPLHYVEGRRYPMIMVVHGGPEAHVPNGWVTSYSNPGQMGAARGFVLFYPNYRGSTGRGVEFSKMGQEDAAGKEFDDLVDAIDHLAGIGLIDPKRVGITGGSYGGYASAWGATYYSDRFAASVMFVGISDNVSKVGTTDIPEEMYLVHHLKRLWDDWDYFSKSSPIYHVQKNRTPTLILHGKDDPRVHASQSLEFHRHLKTLGQAPVRLVLYEGEGHGNRKAASRFDYSLRLMQWMEHYLQGPGGAPPAYALDYEAALK